MQRDWNKAYKEDDTPWDQGYASPPIAEFLQNHEVAGLVLVPGCGSGHDVRLLSGPSTEVVGMDIAPCALKKAEAFPESGSERYVIGDFLDLSQEHTGKYDWVVEHTCLCAIEPDQRLAYVQSLKRALKPEGHFLAVYYREVGNVQGEGPPFPISSEQIETLFSSGFEFVKSFIPTKTYPSRPVGTEEVYLWRMRATKH